MLGSNKKSVDTLDKNNILPEVYKLIVKDCLINSFNIIDNIKKESDLAKFYNDEMVMITPMVEISLPNGYIVYVQKK